MPTWLTFNEPLVRYLVFGGAALVVGIIVIRIWWSVGEAAAAARRRAEVRRARGAVEMEQQERRRLAERIIATSSTAAIAGFVIVRQIEAVFAEGQKSPAEAVELLKTVAARKGANALINLGSQRLPTGKCVASGDAVIVRPAEPPTPAAPPGPPGPAQPG
jgi:hypothetical protein